MSASTHSGRRQHSDGQHLDGVVLLHGYGRTSRSLKNIERALEAADFTTLSLNYQSLRKSIETLAADIDADVAKFAATTDGSIHFVGHSMGGLLTRVYLAKYRPARLGRVVMLGTPNGGSELADVAQRLALYRAFCGPAGQNCRRTRTPRFGHCPWSIIHLVSWREIVPSTRFRHSCRGRTMARFRFVAPGSTAWRITSSSMRRTADCSGIPPRSARPSRFCTRADSCPHARSCARPFNSAITISPYLAVETMAGFLPPAKGLQIAKDAGDAASRKEVVKSLMNSERNFIIKKNEKTTSPKLSPNTTI